MDSAISAGSASRFMLMRVASCFSDTRPLARSLCISSVLTYPGATALTRIPNSAHSVARDLWVPKTSSRSCDQAIFVDQASDASLSCYAVLLKIDRFG